MTVVAPDPAVLALLGGCGWCCVRAGADGRGRPRRRGPRSPGRGHRADRRAALAAAGVMANAQHVPAAQPQLAGADGKFKAGIYELTTGMPTTSPSSTRSRRARRSSTTTVADPRGLHDRRRSPRASQARAGVSRREILELRSRHEAVATLPKTYGFLSGGPATDSLEGYLLPEDVSRARRAPARPTSSR